MQNNMSRVGGSRDFSAVRAREIMLNRGLTNAGLAAELGCHPKTVQGIVNGDARYRSGKVYRRLRVHLSRKHGDIVEQLDRVSVRRVRRNVVIGD